MHTMAVVENGQRLRRQLGLLGEEYRQALVPADRGPELLALGPLVPAERLSGLHCRALLLPGRDGALAPLVSAGWAVSVGLSARDTLTLSSLGRRGLVLAIQREVITLTGYRREPQEVFLPWERPMVPEEALLLVGIQLLLGVPPERLQLP